MSVECVGERTNERTNINEREGSGDVMRCDNTGGNGTKLIGGRGKERDDHQSCGN